MDNEEHTEQLAKLYLDICMTLNQLKDYEKTIEEGSTGEKFFDKIHADSKWKELARS